LSAEDAKRSQESEPVVVSVDIETTGPSPARGSMLSLGAVAYHGVEELGRFYETIYEVTARHADTMRWWEGFPAAWAEATKAPLNPDTVMKLFADWLEALNRFQERKVFIAWPAGFDWGFVNHYFWKYVGKNPLGYSPLCLKSYAAGVLRAPALLTGSRDSFPADWIVPSEFPHHALHDAVAQGRIWLNIRRAATESV
jgi:hypothetical protein